MSQRNIFHIRETADNDLDNIYIYSVENFGVLRAESYLTEIVNNFQTLADNYTLGRDYSHVQPDLYAHNVVSHVIYYKPIDSGIDIYRILHKSMDCKRHM